MWIDCGSQYCSQVDWLMNLIHAITIVSTVLVCGVMVYFVIRYRRRGPDDVTSKVAHNTTIEIVWTVVPTAIMMVLFVMGLVQFNAMRAAPADAMRVDVIGAQWYWEFYYKSQSDPSLELKSPLLFLEENKPTKLVMHSRDVLHSFFVPAFRVKEDVVSNRFATFISFRPHISQQQKAMGPDKRFPGRGEDKKGRDPCIDLLKSGVSSCAAYQVYCTEYCGTSHSGMLNWAVVLPKKDFQNQLAVFEKEATDVSAERGQKIYSSKCIACHSLSGARQTGPTFKGLFGSEREFEDGSKAVANEDYIVDSIMRPQAKTVKGFPKEGMAEQGLSPAEVRSMVEFIKAQN